MEDKLDKKSSPPASPSQGGSAQKPHEVSVSYTKNSRQGAIGNIADRMRGVFSNKTTAILAVMVLVVGVGVATLAVQRSTETRQHAATSGIAPFNSTSLSWNHTVSSGSNRVLIVSVSIKTDTPTSDATALPIVTGITYAGAPLVKKGSFKTNNNLRNLELWYLVNPALGTNTIVVNVSSGSSIVGGATSWSGVNQTTPLAEYLPYQGSGVMAPAITTWDPSPTYLTVGPNDIVIDTIATDQVGRVCGLSVNSPNGDQIIKWAQNQILTGTIGLYNLPGYSNAAAGSSTRAGYTGALSWLVSCNDSTNSNTFLYQVSALKAVNSTTNITFGSASSNRSSTAVTATNTPTPTPDTTDTDGDRYSDYVENYIGTDPLRKCPAAPPTLGVPNSAWPPDLNGDNSVSTLDSDLFTPHFNCTSGSTCYDNRFDLDANGAISGSDVLRLNLAFGTTCQSTSSSISGHVFIDDGRGNRGNNGIANDGVQNGTEPGYNSNGVNIISVVHMGCSYNCIAGNLPTNTNGNYSLSISDSAFGYAVGILSFPTGYKISPGNTDWRSSVHPPTVANFGIILIPANSPTPTPTTVPISTPTPTPGQSCSLKPRGDADCNGKINIFDFNIWRDEFLKLASTTSSNFDGSTGTNPITIFDFNIWRDGFLDPSLPH